MDRIHLCPRGTSIAYAATPSREPAMPTMHGARPTKSMISVLAAGLIAALMWPAAARASGDFGCSPSWKLRHHDFTGCDSMAMLSPGNDTRVNLLLFLGKGESHPRPFRATRRVQHRCSTGRPSSSGSRPRRQTSATTITQRARARVAEATREARRRSRRRWTRPAASARPTRRRCSRRATLSTLPAPTQAHTWR